jgi:protease I
MKVVFVIAENGFKDEELLIPKEILTQKGVKCFIASKKLGNHVGVNKSIVESTLTLGEIGTGFDAIIFVGGPGAEQYFNDHEAQGLAYEYFVKKRVVAAICIAPAILANAGILFGKKVTGFESIVPKLRNKGAEFVASHVVVDGKIITANGPLAAKEFGEAIAKALGK